MVWALCILSVTPSSPAEQNCNHACCRPGRALEAERAAAAAACADARKQQPGRGITPAELDRLLREQRHDAERRCSFSARMHDKT